MEKTGVREAVIADGEGLKPSLTVGLHKRAKPYSP